MFCKNGRLPIQYSNFGVFSKLLITTAPSIKDPAMKTLKGGISVKINQPQIGPNILSVNINNPTVAAGVVRDPIVTKIKPNANWGTPKRKAKLKDTGSLLPGHGGILDRLDSILLGVPVGILTLNYLV